MKHTHWIHRAAIAALSIIAVTTASAQQPGTWTARLRATYLDMANQSDAFTALGINFPGRAVTVEDKLIPEVDFAYWFTEKFSAELVLTIPQEHEVTLRGVGKLGSFKHLPPTLLAQYHFAPGKRFQPYVGAGVNFTLISDVDLKVAGVQLELEDYSIGAAAQAGFDYEVKEGVFLNVDVKKVLIRSDVSVDGGPKLTTADLDPWLYSVGVGYRF